MNNAETFVANTAATALLGHALTRAKSVSPATVGLGVLGVAVGTLLSTNRPPLVRAAVVAVLAAVGAFGGATLDHRHA